jgi:hypothetical protein
VAASFAAPRARGWLPGVWRIDVGTESERYRRAVGAGVSPGAASEADAVSRAEPGPESEARLLSRETRTGGAISIGDWLTPALHYRFSLGADRWNGDRRTLWFGGQIERRSGGDRISVLADVGIHLPLRMGTAFRTGGVQLRTTSSTSATGWVVSAQAGAMAASASAPMPLWPGAGTGHVRGPLLRAHPLFTQGAIQGPALGRELLHGTLEVQRWFTTPGPLRIAAAGFTDVARVRRRLSPTQSPAHLVDAGLGVRIRLPVVGTLRADFARGVRDGEMAFSAGWTN